MLENALHKTQLEKFFFCNHSTHLIFPLSSSLKSVDSIQMVSSHQDQGLTPSKYAIFRWFGFDQFVPEHAVTSHWISSKMFLVIRSILTLYSTVVLWTDIGTSGGMFFQYFTSMTFIGLHAYQVVSSK